MADDPLVVDFPTLLVAHDWVQAHCVVPDGFEKGQPFVFVDWQASALLNFYRLRPDAEYGQLAAAFHFRRSQIVLPQKAGKAPYTAAHVCVEAVGPALFAGWATGDEAWDCHDHGCRCGWVYEYQPGEAMGGSWPTPLIQITATSEEQTDNVYDALRPMIDDGPLHELIPKTGEEFIRLPNKGRIDVVTSNARSRLGQRVTFVPQDETGVWTRQTDMIRVAETQRRGLAGMGGRAEETTNAWDPSENSVAQRTAESKREDIFRYHPQAADSLDYRVKTDRRKIHRKVYRGCRWIDLDVIEAEAAELLETDPGQAERFFGNRTVSGSDRAFEIDVYRGLARPKRCIPFGRKATAGFDGSLTNDATGLVVTDIETGHQSVVAWWARPPIPEQQEWQVPIDELNDAIEFLFEGSGWDIWRLYADPPHYRDDLNRWAGQYGEDRIVAWETANRKPMGRALREFRTDMHREPQIMTHGPLRLYEDDEPDEAALAAHAALVEHVGNAARRSTHLRDESDGSFLWLIGKDAAKSPRKIDLAMAACLSWLARGDAIRTGVLNEEPEYRRAVW